MNDIATVPWTGFRPVIAELYHNCPFSAFLSGWHGVGQTHDGRQVTAPIVPASIAVLEMLPPRNLRVAPDGQVFWTRWGDPLQDAVLLPDGQIWSTQHRHFHLKPLPNPPSAHPIRYLGSQPRHRLLAQPETGHPWIFDEDQWYEVLPSKREIEDVAFDFQIRGCTYDGKYVPSRGRDIVEGDPVLLLLLKELCARSSVHCCFIRAIASPNKTIVMFPHVHGVAWSGATERNLPPFVSGPQLPANLVLPCMEAWVADSSPSLGQPDMSYWPAPRPSHLEGSLPDRIFAVETNLKQILKDEGKAGLRLGHRLDSLYNNISDEVRRDLEAAFYINSPLCKEIIAHGLTPPRLSDVLKFWGRGRGKCRDAYTCVRYSKDGMMPTTFFLGAVQLATRDARDPNNQYRLRKICDELNLHDVSDL